MWGDESLDTDIHTYATRTKGAQGGDWMNLLIKGNLCWKSENNVEWCSEKQGKIISTDAKTNAKQKKAQRNLWLYHINKKGVYVSFNSDCHSIQPSIVQ